MSDYLGYGKIEEEIYDYQNYQQDHFINPNDMRSPELEQYKYADMFNQQELSEIEQSMFTTMHSLEEIKQNIKEILEQLKNYQQLFETLSFLKFKQIELPNFEVNRNKYDSQIVQIMEKVILTLKVWILNQSQAYDFDFDFEIKIEEQQLVFTIKVIFQYQQTLYFQQYLNEIIKGNIEIIEDEAILSKLIKKKASDFEIDQKKKFNIDEINEIRSMIFNLTGQFQNYLSKGEKILEQQQNKNDLLYHIFGPQQVAEFSNQIDFQPLIQLDQRIQQFYGSLTKNFQNQSTQKFELQKFIDEFQENLHLKLKYFQDFSGIVQNYDQKYLSEKIETSNLEDVSNHIQKTIYEQIDDYFFILNKQNTYIYKYSNQKGDFYLISQDQNFIIEVKNKSYFFKLICLNYLEFITSSQDDDYQLQFLYYCKVNKIDLFEFYNKQQLVKFNKISSLFLHLNFSKPQIKQFEGSIKIYEELKQNFQKLKNIFSWCYIIKEKDIIYNFQEKRKFQVSLNKMNEQSAPYQLVILVKKQNLSQYNDEDISNLRQYVLYLNQNKLNTLTKVFLDEQSLMKIKNLQEQFIQQISKREEQFNLEEQKSQDVIEYIEKNLQILNISIEHFTLPNVQSNQLILLEENEQVFIIIINLKTQTRIIVLERFDYIGSIVEKIKLHFSSHEIFSVIFVGDQISTFCLPNNIEDYHILNLIKKKCTEFKRYFYLYFINNLGSFLHEFEKNVKFLQSILTTQNFSRQEVVQTDLRIKEQKNQVTELGQKKFLVQTPFQEQNISQKRTNTGIKQQFSQKINQYQSQQDTTQTKQHLESQDQKNTQQQGFNNKDQVNKITLIQKVGNQEQQQQTKQISEKIESNQNQQAQNKQTLQKIKLLQQNQKSQSDILIHYLSQLIPIYQIKKWNQGYQARGYLFQFQSQNNDIQIYQMYQTYQKQNLLFESQLKDSCVTIKILNQNKKLETKLNNIIIDFIRKLHENNSIWELLFIFTHQLYRLVRDKFIKNDELEDLSKVDLITELITNINETELKQINIPQK